MVSQNDLTAKINERYACESKNSSNLSCGGNLDFLEIREGEKILDLGCGRGSETLQAALLTGAEGLSVGVDITQPMIDEALAAAEGIGAGNARFILADIENLPFENTFFDAVISNCAINHARDKARVYREIYRVLKNSGRFVVSDAVTKYPLPLEVTADPESWAQCFGGAVTEDSYLKAVQDAGFSDIRILGRREYIKNGYDFISLTIKACKNNY